MIYRTKDGDMVDHICYKHYGSGHMTSVVLQENTGLAELGPVLPAGIEITLPQNSPQNPIKKPIRLWGGK